MCVTQAAKEAQIRVCTSLKHKETIVVNVSYDGTDVISEFVLDFEVLSKYCQNCVVTSRDMGVDCAKFHMRKGQADECSKNFEGTYRVMVMHAALIMWKRLISDCQMRFVSILSDGDSKTLQFLSGNKIYESSVKIDKVERLNHIAKRLGTSLYAIKLKNRK
ncbi:uncharacterized protein TNCV_2386221 [Trichonephila clavipes]|nr:uncharacterized protein TNCV_2386221 [Trichonephila clavipes]